MVHNHNGLDNHSSYIGRIEMKVAVAKEMVQIEERCLAMAKAKAKATGTRQESQTVKAAQTNESNDHSHRWQELSHQKRRQSN